MQITNVSTSTIDLGDLNQANLGVSGTIITPGSSVVVFDADAAKSAQLQALMTANLITKTGDLEPGETALGVPVAQLADKLATYIISTDTVLQWKDHAGTIGTTDSGTYAAAAALRTVSLNVTNGANVVDTLNSTTTALITVTGTATGVSLNGTLYSAPVTLTLTNGVCPVLIASTDSGSKTVVLTITSCVPTTLTKTAVMTYSFS